MHAGFGGLHWIALVMDGRGRARQVVNAIDLHVKRKGNVMALQFEIGMLQQVDDVAPGAGVEIVNTQHIMPLFQQSLTQVRPEESGTAGNQYA
jgi:hypothetical protein